MVLSVLIFASIFFYNQIQKIELEMKMKIEKQTESSESELEFTEGTQSKRRNFLKALFCMEKYAPDDNYVRYEYMTSENDTYN